MSLMKNARKLRSLVLALKKSTEKAALHYRTIWTTSSSSLCPLWGKTPLGFLLRILSRNWQSICRDLLTTRFWRAKAWKTSCSSTWMSVLRFCFKNQASFEKSSRKDSSKWSSQKTSSSQPIRFMTQTVLRTIRISWSQTTTQTTSLRTASQISPRWNGSSSQYQIYPSRPRVTTFSTNTSTDTTLRETSSWSRTSSYTRPLSVRWSLP